MTIPDVRDLDIEDAIRANEAAQAAQSCNTNLIAGYACASAIVIAMLYFDGIIALTAAGAVAGSIAGINIGRKL